MMGDHIESQEYKCLACIFPLQYIKWKRQWYWVKGPVPRPIPLYWFYGVFFKYIDLPEVHYVKLLDKFAVKNVIILFKFRI